jgi:hypothetical protein
MATAGLGRAAKRDQFAGRDHFFAQGEKTGLAGSEHQAEAVLAGEPVGPLQAPMVEGGLKAVATQRFRDQMG